MSVQHTLPGIPAEPGDPLAPAHDAEAAYFDLFRPMVHRAYAAGTMSELVGALTWTLAYINVHFCEEYFAGDAARRYVEALCRVEGR